MEKYTKCHFIALPAKHLQAVGIKDGDRSRV